MQKRSFEEASGVPLQAAKLRRRDTLAAAKDTLRHLHSANHVVTAGVASGKHRGWLQEMVSAVEETVKLLEKTDATAAGEEPPHRPTSPSYSPEYDPSVMHSDDDEPVYAVLRGPAAEPQCLDPVEVHTPHLVVKAGVLIGKDKGRGMVKFPNGDIGIFDMSEIHDLPEDA